MLNCVRILNLCTVLYKKQSIQVRTTPCWHYLLCYLSYLNICICFHVTLFYFYSFQIILKRNNVIKWKSRQICCSCFHLSYFQILFSCVQFIQLNWFSHETGLSWWLLSLILPQYEKYCFSYLIIRKILSRANAICIDADILRKTY